MSANIHFTQKVEKYLQNGQLQQLKSDLPFNLTRFAAGVLKALVLDLIRKIAVMDDFLNHKVPRTSAWHWFRQLQYWLKTNCALIRNQRSSECWSAKRVIPSSTRGTRTSWCTDPDRQVLLDPHAWHAPGLRRKHLQSCWHRENRVSDGSRCVPRSASPRFQLRRGH